MVILLRNMKIVLMQLDKSMWLKKVVQRILRKFVEEKEKPLMAFSGNMMNNMER